MRKVILISVLCLMSCFSCNKIDKENQNIKNEPRDITITVEKDAVDRWGIYVAEYDDALYNKLSALAQEYHENLLNGVRDDDITKPFWTEFNDRDWLYSDGFSLKKTFDITIPGDELLIIIYGNAFYSSYANLAQPYYYVLHETVTGSSLYISLKQQRFN